MRSRYIVLVRTEEGLTPIEDIGVGDLVCARHEETREPALAAVTALMAREVSQFLTLTLRSETGEESALRVTASHPLHHDGQWVGAGGVGVGDAIEDSAGALLTITAIALDPAPTRVHNLTIAGAESYFAGDLEAWSHIGRFFRGGKRLEAMDRNGGNCVRCGRPGEQADHIWPYSRGGPTEVINGQPFCCECNRRKGAEDPTEGVDLSFVRPPVND